MFYSTITLRFDPAESHFVDVPFEEFSKSREILSVKDHFFTHGGLPHLLLCVSWRMPAGGSARKPRGKEDWKDLLTTPEANDRFDRLRRWRNELAKQEGKPAYAILTNRLAAEIAALSAPSLTAISNITNLGPARIEKYGRGILEILGVAVDG